MPRYCFTTTLHPQKHDEYKEWHDNIYPEVARGLTRAGVTQLTIFRVPNTSTLILYATTKPGVDLNDATGPDSAYRASHERIRQWETIMETEFHCGWSKCEEIHSSDVQWIPHLSSS
mmetsp:Transcript_727/g.1551  ORF Transcript_727/g.1551 Transcript_727/m.1551 type:complete len:117 (+) Transcript_727:11-361(+)